MTRSDLYSSLQATGRHNVWNASGQLWFTGPTGRYFGATGLVTFVGDNDAAAVMVLVTANNIYCVL